MPADSSPQRLRSLLLALALAGIGGLSAATRVQGDPPAAAVIDYRAPPAIQRSELTRAERALIRSAAAASEHDALHVLGRVDARLGTGRTKASVFLVGIRDGRSAASPWHSLSLIALRGAQPAGNWPLPLDAGNGIDRVLDIDADGRDEILLRADSYQMGVSRVDLSLWALTGGAARRLAQIDRAWHSTCDRRTPPHAIRSKRIIVQQRADGTLGVNESPIERGCD